MPDNKEKTPSGEKKRSKMLRAFENNTLLLIFSILCATVIWFIMMATSGENRATVVSNVPINIEVSEWMRISTQRSRRRRKNPI